MLTGTGILLGLWLPLAAAAQDARTIHTSGVGSVAEVPDMAEVSIGATHEALTAAAALGATSEDLRAVLDVLEAAGIAPRDIATGSVTVQPVRSRGDQSQTEPPRITGFQASNTLSVRVRDIAQVGRVLDAAVQDGANTFNGLRFSFQDPEPLQDRARAAAVRDAMRRAAQLAAASGVTLGPVLKITETDGAPGPSFDMAASARMSDVPVAVGEQTIRVRVEMIFAIDD
ncbi:SIMPL domain-containing protein [Roseobacter ponti]|uniref:SIMPL domain-containing protein n=2 Tax=Roseobacter ponti TaxID=1891787 RepID=A0A858SVY6_9RHOB|nr:SIMPL domain-containing protein [Roseobacter ponti]